MEKKRVIVDYSTLPDEILEIMANKYPYGYERDIIKFPNSKGEMISAVRVETDDTIYLVKVSTQLKQMVEDYDIEEVDLSSEVSDNDNDEEEDDQFDKDKPEDDDMED